jgi:hypothetical protein
VDKVIFDGQQPRARVVWWKKAKILIFITVILALGNVLFFISIQLHYNRFLAKTMHMALPLFAFIVLIVDEIPIKGNQIISNYF